jgi:hypothetical protein
MLTTITTGCLCVGFLMALYAVFHLERQLIRSHRDVARLIEKLADARGVRLEKVDPEAVVQPLYSEWTDEEGTTHIADGTTITKDPRPRIVVTDDQIQ